MSDLSSADLRRLLKEQEAREATTALETPHSRLLAELADHRVIPVELGNALARVFDALDLLGVDLLGGEGHTARLKASTQDVPVDQAPADAVDPVDPPTPDKTATPADVAKKGK